MEPWRRSSDIECAREACERWTFHTYAYTFTRIEDDDTGEVRLYCTPECALLDAITRSGDDQ